MLKKLKELELFSDDIPNNKGVYLRSALIKPNISPYLVYLILKEQFGNPNSDRFDEDKSQWQWTFRFKDFYVEVYDWKLLSTSIAIYHSKDHETSNKLGLCINTLLEKLAEQKKNTLKAKAKNSKHKLLENPFVTYYSTAENLVAISKKIDQSIMYAGEQRDSIFDLLDKKSDLYRSAFLMLLSSFEGFLNILYELYLKPELRTERLAQRIYREQIDIKLRIAPIYCDGFRVKTINDGDERFRKYLMLVNLRNDYVHANLIKSLERYIVTEDNYEFILEIPDHSDIPTNINNLELEHVELARKIIDDVVELVFESMETKTRREFKSFIFESEISVEEEDGIYIPS